jgi:hypothetical protein
MTIIGRGSGWQKRIRFFCRSTIPHQLLFPALEAFSSLQAEGMHSTNHSRLRPFDAPKSVGYTPETWVDTFARRYEGIGESFFCCVTASFRISRLVFFFSPSLDLGV